MSVEKINENINSVDLALNNLWEFSEWIFRIREFVTWLDEESTNQICNIFDNAFNWNITT